MTTERQIRANRLNAAKSTGPRTATGKAAIARNAIRHGLTARLVVMTWEDAATFEALRQALHDELKPACVAATELVEHLAALLWRLHRSSAYESALLAWISHQQAEMHDGDGMTLGEVFLPGDRRGLTNVSTSSRTASVGAAQLQLGRTLDGAIGSRDLLGKLGRYEAHLLRQVERTLRALELMASKPSKAPARAASGQVRS